ncbi:MAG: hypothetical protein FD167_3437 [bacterium]|nr:MAG: hypothetical protein FD167_3437 [bacterium]
MEQFYYSQHSCTCKSLNTFLLVVMAERLAIALLLFIVSFVFGSGVVIGLVEVV